jgi:sensor histidine kinase regulating citrate/malate metabolism
MAYIELSVTTQGSQFAVRVKNNFNGEVAVENGRPISAKKDGGFGLRSIQTLINRLEGHTLFEWDKESFTSYVLLPGVITPQ